MLARQEFQQFYEPLRDGLIQDLLVGRTKLPSNMRLKIRRKGCICLPLRCSKRRRYRWLRPFRGLSGSGWRLFQPLRILHPCGNTFGSDIAEVPFLYQGAPVASAWWALTSKNSAWLMTAFTVSVRNGLVTRNVGSGRAPVNTCSG